MWTRLLFALLIVGASGSSHTAQEKEKAHLVFFGGSRGNNFEIVWTWLTGLLNQDARWDASVEVIPGDGIGGLEAVGAGKADFTLVKAPPTVGLAYKGKGLFATPNRRLRAMGVLPVTDWLTFAVRPKLGAGSVRELLRSQRPLRIATGRDSPRDTVTFLLEEIFRFHGTSFEELERRGGKLLRVEPGASIQLGVEGKVDVVFQEAQNVPVWDALFAKGWKVLPLDDGVLSHLEKQYGFARRAIPATWYRSERRLQTVEYSNVLLCAREEVPEKVVAWVVRTFLENKVGLEDTYRNRKGRRSWLDYPIDPQFFASPTTVPHHPGAAEVFKSLASR